MVVSTAGVDSGATITMNKTRGAKISSTTSPSTEKDFVRLEKEKEESTTMGITSLLVKGLPPS